MDPIHFINWHLSARFFVWSMPEPVWFYSRLVSCSRNTWFNDWLIFAWLKQMLLTSSSCFSGHDNKKDTVAVQMDTTVHYTRNTSPLSWTHKEQRIRYWCKTLNNLFQVGNKCIIEKMKPSLRQMRESFIKYEIPRNKNFIRIRNKNFCILLVILKLSLLAIKISWLQCVYSLL